MKYFKRIIAIVGSLSSPHPLRDWVLVLTVNVLILIVLVGIAVQFFFGIQSGNSIGSRSPERLIIERIPQTELETLVQTLEKRRSAYEAGTISVPELKDPSR